MDASKLPPLSMEAQSLAIGSVYRHYKGNIYKILAVARHSETCEEMVVYQSVDEVERVWVRPLRLFFQTIEIDGQLQARFVLVNSVSCSALPR